MPDVATVTLEELVGTVCDEPQHLAPGGMPDPAVMAGKTVKAYCGATFVARGVWYDPTHRSNRRFCRACLTIINGG